MIATTSNEKQIISFDLYVKQKTANQMNNIVLFTTRD